MVNPNVIKPTKGERVFDVINYTVMGLIILAVLLPLLSVVSTSLVSAREIAEKRFIIIPSQLDFNAYTVIFSKGSVIIDAYVITLFRLVAGTVVSVVLTYFLAYGLAKKELPFRKGITVYIFITMLFSGGLIPYYILIRSIGLMNNLLVYILPIAISAWYTLLLRNFIMGIPESIFESAEIDGAGEVRILFEIVLPLSVPALATIALFYAVGQWNSWWDAFLFVSEAKLQPIQLVLRNVLSVTTINIANLASAMRGRSTPPPARSIQNAVIVVGTLPVVLIYPFVQKYFVKGIMMGSVKG